jgi:DNA-directed RNA polymerase subunit RPC12/RpoP
MPFMVCPSCQAQIDITDLEAGTRVTCAECSTAVTVNRQTALLDPNDAQAAIARARDRVRGETKTRVKCPNCEVELELRPGDTAAGKLFRCTECGQKILMSSRPGAKGSDTVTFPTLAPEGTLLDMGDTKQVGKKPPDNKK